MAGDILKISPMWQLIIKASSLRKSTRKFIDDAHAKIAWLETKRIVLYLSLNSSLYTMFIFEFKCVVMIFRCEWLDGQSIPQTRVRV